LKIASKQGLIGYNALQMSPIQQGLQDAHPYVRRTAVMGVLKVYHLDKAAVLNAGEPQIMSACLSRNMSVCYMIIQLIYLLTGMLDTLKDMMVQDKDAQVVANCMSVLKQVNLSVNEVNHV